MKKKPSKKRCEKNIGKRWSGPVPARHPREDPEPNITQHNINKTHKSEERHIQTEAHTGLDTLDPSTRLGRLRARSGYRIYIRSGPEGARGVSDGLKLVF